MVDRSAAGGLAVGRAPDGWVVGVAGGAEPRRQLEQAGLDVAYANQWVAMAGTVATVDQVVVGGRAIVDDRGSNDPRALLATAWAGGGASQVMSTQAIFGAVFHDGRSGRTTLARDPLGERTMYLSSPDGDGRVWFADRLVTLRGIGAVGGELNLEALRDYLIFAYVPGTSTLLAGAGELSPGTTQLLIDPGAGITPRSMPEAQRWWHLTEGVASGSCDDLPRDAAKLRSLLESAVDSRRPDGPVGVYLSGGVDSSAVTALLCRHDPSDIHTFAVHFGADLPNELAFVDQVVARTQPGTHHEIELSPRELLATLPETMAALDDPIGDPLTVPNLALGRRAVDIVGSIFNGEGGDPVFGGPKNQPMLLAALYGTDTRSPAIDELYLRSYQKCYDDLDRLLRPEVAGQLAAAPDPTALIAPYLSHGSMRSFVNRLFEANTRLKGCDHILTKVSNLTAAAGLIGRSPLFDRHIVEAAFSMAPTTKLDGTIEKAVLKAAVADLLPAPIIERPKAGMRVPVQTWFRGPLRREGSKRLLSRRAKIGPYLDRSTIKSWTRYDGDPRGRYGRKLWLLLSLEHWLEAHDAG